MAVCCGFMAVALLVMLHSLVCRNFHCCCVPWCSGGSGLYFLPLFTPFLVLGVAHGRAGFPRLNASFPVGGELFCKVESRFRSACNGFQRGLSSDTGLAICGRGGLQQQQTVQATAIIGPEYFCNGFHYIVMWWVYGIFHAGTIQVFVSTSKVTRRFSTRGGNNKRFFTLMPGGNAGQRGYGLGAQGASTRVQHGGAPVCGDVQGSQEDAR